MAVKSICGVIIVSENIDALARFYSEVFDFDFEREDHGGLALHYGVDIGDCHFAIQPPANMGRDAVGNSSTTVAFNVENLDEIIDRLKAKKAEQVQSLRDEGFGRTTTFLDPDGNQVEVVELKYEFSE